MSGVGLANRFAFLEEDGTSSGAVSAPQVKPAAATAQKPQGTNQRTTGQQQQQQQQQRAPQQQQRPRPARPVQTGDFEHRPEGTEGSERGNRRGGFRGGRGGQREGGQREGGRPPKREFDRHSGSDKTGVKAIEKKGSRFNWGSDETKIRRGTSNTNNRRINEERADSDEDTASAVASETPAPLAEGAEGLNAEGSLTAGESSTASTDAAAATTTAAAAAPKEEEGPKLLTLEEFKRLQEASAPKTELPKLRQAGENVDNSQWKNAVALTKNDDTEFFVPKKATTTSTSSSSSSSASSSSSSSNKPKKVEVNITFFDPEQQRNERFDRVNKDNKDNKEKESSSSSSSSSASPSSSSPSSRGGNSGRGGRGGKPQTSSRGGYRSKPNFDVNDQKVFPTLGGK